MPIIDIYIAAGQKNYIFETFPTDETVIELSGYIKEKLPDSYIITSFAVDQNGYTTYGKYYLNILNKIRLIRSIDAYGLNCACGPLHIKELADRLNKSDTISIMPNAGYPTVIGDKTEYIDNPEYFADKLYALYKSGVKILGGCCGTTPRHIAAARKLLDENGGVEKVLMTETGKPVKKVVNPFVDIIKDNAGKIILVEYDPPLNATAKEITDSARRIGKAGADAITVADNPLGRARADSLLVAARINNNSGIVVIPHLTCRDRNAISIRSALMGLNIEGIHNILCITGDPVPNLNESKGVFSFNSMTLISYIESINHESVAGEFYEGAALNINANRFHLELERAIKKSAAGAKFFITQPCFTETALNNSLLAKEILKLPVFVGIMPLRSYKNALFVKSEISGIDIPDQIAERFKDKTDNECIDISVAVSMDTVIKAAPYVDGFHIISPIRGIEIVEKLIKEIKKCL